MEVQFDAPWLRFLITPDEAGQTCGEFLDQWPGSRTLRYKLEISNQLTLNGQPVRQTEKLKAKDMLALKVLAEEEPDFPPWDQPLKILYEDALILAVSKPSGMIVHPDAKDKNGTLANQVAAYYLSAAQPHAVRPIHRLDEGTSGIVLFSKCPFFQPYFDQALADKQIQRTYLAVAEGVMKPGTKVCIDQPIGRDRHRAGAYRVSPTGRPACTHAEVLRCFQKDRRTLLQCTLETGRTHQIRVHLASIGHPIVNDPLYSRRSVRGRMLLHAWKCEWRDPLSGKRIEIADEAESGFWK